MYEVSGAEILKFIKRKRNAYFSKTGWQLVGCEIPIQLTPNPTYKNTIYKGYLDLVLYHEPTNKIKIVDIKTSTRGWSDINKKDEDKQFQLILYKQYFSQYQPQPSKHNCSFCPFKDKKELCDKGLTL